MWTATASHLLDIHKCRRDMQRDGITNPRSEIKRFCEELVAELEKLDRKTEIAVVEGESGEKDFIAGGRILATLPPDR